MKNIITTLLFIISFNSFAQERIGTFKNDLKKGESFVNDIIPIVNSKNNDVAVFVADAKNVYGYKLNNKFDVTSKITSEEKRRKYRTLLGYSIPNENNYKIILSNKNENKFLIVDFSFSNKTATTKEFILENSSEKIVQTLSIDNKFYLITAVPFNDYDKNDGTPKSESQINFNDDFVFFYSIDKDNSLSRKKINLSEFRFVDKKNKRLKIRSLILPRFDGKIPKIDTSVANSVDITAKTSKLYFDKNKVYFSFDKNNESTQVLEINLDNFTARKDSFEKKLPKAKRSNSFFYENKVVIASANKKELLLEILDSKSKNILKKFNIYEDKDIEFKNSPIAQRGGVYAGYRELKTAKQFLRKITADKFGVTILRTDNTYELSVGGYSPKPSGGGMMMGGMGGFGGIPIGSIGGASLFFNPTMLAYNASNGTKSTQIDCLLNEQFEHVKGEIPKNSFDKIDDFLDDSDNDFIEVFKLNNQTILGSYHKRSRIYYFNKF